MMRGFLAILVLLCGLTRAPAQAQPPAPEKELPAEKPRRIYVLHSGLHTILSDPDKNTAALSVRDGLRERGIHSANIIVLENPFPTATWKRVVPWQGVNMFLDCAVPGSEESLAAYLRMHEALKSQKVGPKDEIIWIGHSAGGQIGLTMAHLSQNLQKYPNLARAAQSYRFDMVITLGTPVAFCPPAPDVKLRYYYSPQDRIVRWTAHYGSPMLRLLGYQLSFELLPGLFQGNSKVRVFAGVEHPYWDCDARVLDRIVAETSGRVYPPWQSPLLGRGPGQALLRLVCQGLDACCNLSVEDPPH